jgi:hypothetical protein
MSQRNTEPGKSLSFLDEAQIPSVLHTADCLHGTKLGPFILGTCLGFALSLLFAWQAEDPRAESL